MDGEIDTDAVADLLEGGAPPAGTVLVDIRSRAAFRRGHVPGSVCLPFGELQRSVDRLDGAEQVVTICPHGASSLGAARLIASYDGLAEDATVQSMAGGLAAWNGELVAGEESAAGGADDRRPAAEDDAGADEAPF